METEAKTAKAPESGLLKNSALLLIVFAALGVAVAVVAAIAALSGAGAVASSDPAAGDPELLALVRAAIVVAAALIGNLPRLIAGIMGRSRCKNPENHNFFLGWGAALLVLGIVGMSFAGNVLSPSGLVSVVGGLVLPICYIIGASFPPFEKGGRKL